jgi:hypothetical protein
MTYGLMTMKNALIQIAAEKGNNVVPQAGRRAKSDKTKSQCWGAVGISVGRNRLFLSM